MPKPTKSIAQLHVYVEPEQYDALRKLAFEKRTSISAIVNELMFSRSMYSDLFPADEEEHEIPEVNIEDLP